MFSIYPETKTPSWHDVNTIIKDLRDVLDSLESLDGQARAMRMAIARAMAQMREEKIIERKVNLVRDLVAQLSSFTLQDAGVLDHVEMLSKLDLSAYRRVQKARA